MKVRGQASVMRAVADHDREKIEVSDGPHAFDRAERISESLQLDLRRSKSSPASSPLNI